MSASLVGSEMCIRDSAPTEKHFSCTGSSPCVAAAYDERPGDPGSHRACCLLYTSDAADDM
eukprot:3650234-Alexandrium_andersonii.AAC.1